MMRVIGAFVCAVATTYVLASFASTQWILGNVAEMGVAVDFSARIEATLHDLAGMTSIYLPLIGIGFLIAFSVTAMVLRFLPNWRTIGYLLGGASALLAIHLIMQALLGMHPLPVTRTLPGLLLQVAAGAAGGYAFVLLTHARVTLRSSHGG